jgi:GINS complex subunit 4
LQQLLHQEKSSPELLPYQVLLIGQISKRIFDQERQLQRKINDTDDRFYFNVHKMELERVKYLLKSYLRTRLFKMEKHLLYLVEKDQAHLLSEAEMQYARSSMSQKSSTLTNLFSIKYLLVLNPF